MEGFDVMTILEPQSDEAFVRLPESGTRCPHSGLERGEIENLIFPTPANGGEPALRYKSIEAPGKEPVILISWLHLQAWILKQDPRRSYETPRSFYQWIARHPSCHLDEIPNNIVQVTNLFQSGEEPQFEVAVNEQLSMNRAVFVLYTRKGAAVGYRKKR